MTKATIVLLLVMAAVAASCKKEATTSDTSAHDSAVHIYGCGQNEAAKSGGYICFDSLVTDSRCPSDVQCVWMGVAVIKVSFHEGSNVHRFSMILPALKGFGAVNDTVVNGYRIALKDIAPYPRSNNPFPVSDYSALFTISH